MFRSTPSIALLLAATTVALPAPSHAAAPVYEAAGASCALDARRTDSESINGLVRGGPFAVVSDFTAADNLRVICTVQVNEETPGSSERYRATSPAGDGVATLEPRAASLTALNTDNIYVCTYIRWDSNDGPFTYVFDMDAATTGVQCERAIVADALTVAEQKACAVTSFSVERCTSGIG